MSLIQQKNGKKCGALSWLLLQELVYWKTSNKTANCSHGFHISTMWWTVVFNYFVIEGWGLGEGFESKKRVQYIIETNFKPLSEPWWDIAVHLFTSGKGDIAGPWESISVGLLIESPSLNNGSLPFLSTCYIGIHTSIPSQRHWEYCATLLPCNCGNWGIDIGLEFTSCHFKSKAHIIFSVFHLPSWLFLKYRTSWFLSSEYPCTLSILQTWFKSRLHPDLPGLPLLWAFPQYHINSPLWSFFPSIP